ncbi:MAG TPA: hypothetical protein VK851_08915, partial [Anaerolineales bacterium]|nr:hypothetical protein [Anaerolineales bacterium]
MDILSRAIKISLVVVFLVGCSSINETGSQPSIPSQFPRICERYNAPPNYSPDSLWMTESCYNEDDKSLILTISNKETRGLWKLLYRDYIPPMEFMPDGGIAVAHWSNDKKYAYFYTYSNSSGGWCFRTYSSGGWGLFELELQNGKITPILPLSDSVFSWYGFSFSPANNKLIYGLGAKNFIIRDMKTNESLDINHEKDFDDSGGFLWFKDESKFVYSTETWTSDSENYSLR